MKKQLLKSLLASSFVLSALAAVSQPTLTGAGCNPVIGDSYTIIQSNYLSPGSSGANQTWNLSSLNNTSQESYTFMGVASTPYASSFPGANIAGKKSSADDYSFFETSSSVCRLKGLYVSSHIMSYSDPQDMLRYPFTYNNSYTDTWATSFTNVSMQYYRKGTTTLTADGYGTVITPAGTFNNALRVHEIDNYQDSTTLSGAPYIITYQNDSYYWYCNGFPTAVAASISLVTGGSTFQYSIYSHFTTGIEEQQQEIVSLRLYPNPVSDELTVNFDSERIENAEIRIIDFLGKVIISEKVNLINTNSENLKFNVSALEPGIYYLQMISDNNKYANRKFMISR